MFAKVILFIYFIFLVVFFAFPKQIISKQFLFDKNTFYHRIRVVQKSLANGDQLKTLYLDSTIEGAQFKKSRQIPCTYQRYWELCRLIKPKVENALFLGGGAFAMPESLLEAYPKAEVDVVEIDPKVVDVGTLFFRLNEYPKINTIQEDARRYLYHTTKRYDFIFGDVYNGVRYIPAHLVTKEFFEIIRDHLSDNGIYMMNIISSIKGNNSTLFKSVAKTLCSVFDNIIVFAITPNFLNMTQNVVLLTSNYKISLDIDTNKNIITTSLKKLLATHVSRTKYDISDAPLLTDEYNPVEYIVAKSLQN